MDRPTSLTSFRSLPAWGVLLTLLLGMPGGIARAANPLLPDAASTAAAPAAASTTEVITAGDIPMRADIDERFVQEVLRRAQEKDPSAKLRPRLDELARGIDDLSKSVKRDELKQLSAVRLESLESHWKFYDRELAEWRRDLDRVTAPYSEDAAALAQRHSTWEATAKSLESGVASALSDRVHVILGQITQAERALSVPLDNQMKLRRRANIVQASIDAGRKQIDAAIAYYDHRLSMIDAPPVWEAWRDTQFTAGELKGAETGLRLESEFLAEWGAANQDRLVWYRIWTIGLLPLLLWLWRRSRKTLSSEPEMAAATKVLRRPISAWLVLSLVGIPFIFPDAPLVMHQAALMVAVIPVLRLLPPQIFQLLGPWPYIATVLYVLYRLSFLLLGQALYYRLYILAFSAVTAIVILWLLVSRRPGPGVEVGRAQGIVRTLGWVAILALAVGIVANVIGNVSLAEMLGSAVLESAYVGLALFAGANVLSSVLSLLLARRAMSRFHVITQHAGPLLASATRLIKFAALTIWVFVTLNQFRIARPVFGWIKDVLTHPLEAGQISITLGSVVLFALSIWIAFWVAKTVRYVLADEVLPKMQLPRGVSNSVSSLSYYALILIGLMVSLAAAGFETSQFAIIFGALGIGIGLGLQNVVNNFVSGLILMFERPIQPGDVVEVSGTSGKVREIGMRATTLTTFEGADVVVPNGTLLSEKLINWTLSDMNRRVDVNVGVAYGSDPRRVITLLGEVARSTPGVAPTPEPTIVFIGFGTNSLDFSIRAWTNDFADWVAIRTEMTARVYEALKAEGIEIPFPQQDLHLRSVSQEAGARLGGLAAAQRAGQPTT